MDSINYCLINNEIKGDVLMKCIIFLLFRFMKWICMFV